MPPPPHSKPENVFKRAQELIGVEQQQAALSLLHDHVTSKRTRNSPITSLEPVMMLFVELCVDLRRGKLAKDGLYQYKNIAQNTNVGTIELVFKHFIDLAEKKVTEAQAKADEVQTELESKTAGDALNVDDLEASETPESILLSTVSGEQSRDRTDRAIVTPWLKFLWETYRIVLDVFKNNAKLEVMYQTTAHQAFQFCSKYARKTEFRRLCELLRNHLQNAAKFSSQMHAINLSDPDTLQRHLDTRFQQLNVAVELELWQEAFRSVEDIHTLLSLSKRPAKNIMMANYFEKLTRIFLVSENYLFHAAAWSRYYNLMRQSAAAVASGQSPKKDNPAVTEADMTKAASFVLLSALSIPVISTARSRGALVDAAEAKNTKNVRLTNLLGMTQVRTRAILFKDALSKGLLKRCRPEIRDLYSILEVDFHPLVICKKISPILSQIGADEEMKQYVGPLQQVILTRLFQQLSQVYDSVKLEFVLTLAQFPEPFETTKSGIEKFIMNGCKKGDLAIRIDHSTGVLAFDSDVFSSARALHPGSGAGSAEAESSTVQRLQSTPAEIVRTTLVRLAKSLYTTCQYVDPSFNAARLEAKQQALLRAKEGAEQERVETLLRKDMITKKKEAAANAHAQKERDLAVEKRQRAQQQLAAESKRLADEQKARDLRRIEAEKMRIQEEEAHRALEELKRGTKGINFEDIDVANLDTGAIRAIKIQALEKEKNKLSDTLRVTARRIDHLERAYRLEEIKHLRADYDRQLTADRKLYDETNARKLVEGEQKHKDDVALKHRLERLVGPYEEFKKEITSQRKSDFEKRRKAAEKELQAKIEQRKREVMEQRLRAKRMRAEKKQREQEEEEARAKEEEERARIEEERKQRAAERKAEAEKRNKELDEQAAKMRAKEEEAERKILEKRQGRSAASAGFERRADGPPASEGASERPRLALTGRSGAPPTSDGGWRAREAAKVQSGGTDTPPSKAPEPEAAAAAPQGEAPKRTGYVNPAARGEGARPVWRESENSGRGANTSTPPAPSGAKFIASHMRNRGPDPRARDASPAGRDVAELPAERTGSSGAPGIYVPGAFKKSQAGR